MFFLGETSKYSVIFPGGYRKIIRTPHSAGQANLKIIEVLLDFGYMVDLI